MARLAAKQTTAPAPIIDLRPWDIGGSPARATGLAAGAPRQRRGRFALETRDLTRNEPLANGFVTACQGAKLDPWRQFGTGGSTIGARIPGEDDFLNH